MGNEMSMRQLETLIQKVIAALTVLDADALARLQPEIDTLAAIGISSDEDLLPAALAHRLLGRLLEETERNLRMFRVTSNCVGQMDPGIHGKFFGPSELTRG